jgi:hypothetical protein
MVSDNATGIQPIDFGELLERCWKDLAVCITTVLETDNYKGFGGRVSRDYRANTPPRPANSAKERKRYVHFFEASLKTHGAPKNLVEGKKSRSGEKSATNYQHVGESNMGH